MFYKILKYSLILSKYLPQLLIRKMNFDDSKKVIDDLLIY
jgi:hypothetical protein